MPRMLRVEYQAAVYRVVSRGDGPLADGRDRRVRENERIIPLVISDPFLNLRPQNRRAEWLAPGSARFTSLLGKPLETAVVVLTT